MSDEMPHPQCRVRVNGNRCLLDEKHEGDHETTFVAPAPAGTEPATPSLREHRHICTDLECSGDCVCGICGVPFATRDEDDWVLDPSQEEQLRKAKAKASPSPSSIPAVTLDRMRERVNAHQVATTCPDCGALIPCDNAVCLASRLSESSLPAPAGLPRETTPYTTLAELDADEPTIEGTLDYLRDVVGHVNYPEIEQMVWRLFATARLAVEAQQDRREGSGAASGEPRSESDAAERLTRIMESLRQIDCDDSKNLAALIGLDVAMTDASGTAIVLTSAEFWWMVEQLREAEQERGSPASRQESHPPRPTGGTE